MRPAVAPLEPAAATGTTARARTLALLGVLVWLVAAGGATAQPSEVPFEDATEASGLSFVHDNGATGELFLPEIMGPGGALLDYDRDGDLDVYLVQGHRLGTGGEQASAVDRLYRNDRAFAGPQGALAGARFVDVTAASGLLPSAYGIGAATGDIDNDGWPDLYISNLGANQLLRNNRDGTFSDITLAAGVNDDRWSVAASFLDYDLDGWLDLWVVNYLDFSIAKRKHCLSPTGAADYCDPKAYEPVTDSLFHNRGDGTFERATSRAGIDREAGAGLGVVAADLNRDGWLDVYVTNDGMANQFYVNKGDGTFREEALFAGCGVSGEGAAEASMGVVAADFDNDGDEDLFLTHLSKETNTLYVNDGNGFFRDGTEGARLGVPSWNYTGFGTGLLDFDADGLLDLLVVNGAVTFFSGGPQRRLEQPNQLFRNVGGKSFEPVGSAADFGVDKTSRGALMGDLDNDGDTDVIVLNNASTAQVLNNRRIDRGSWLGLRLMGRESGRDVLGAKAELRLGEGRSLWRRAHSDGGYASAGDPRVVFGLEGTAGPEETLTVRIWTPEGRSVRFAALPRARYFEVYLPD